MTHRILCPDTYLALEASRLAQTTDQVVLVARDVAQMDKFDEVLRLARATVLPFPQWEILPFDRFSPHSEITARRLRTLRALTQGGRGVVLMTAAGVAQKLIGRKTLTAASQVLALGDEWSNAQAEATVARAGYRRVDLVEGPGGKVATKVLVAHDQGAVGGKAPAQVVLADDGDAAAVGLGF